MKIKLNEFEMGEKIEVLGCIPSYPAPGVSVSIGIIVKINKASYLVAVEKYGLILFSSRTLDCIRYSRTDLSIRKLRGQTQ